MYLYIIYVLILYALGGEKTNDKCGGSKKSSGKGRISAKKFLKKQNMTNGKCGQLKEYGQNTQKIKCGIR